MKTALKNLGLLLCSVFFSLVILEVGLRLFTPHPITVSSNKIADPVLRYKMNPWMKGIDKNGFRNEKVLTTAKLVALGDSHTYSRNALPQDAWPKQLGRMLNVDAYNFGVGGYGPIQYDLLLDQAVALSPDYLVIGLYLSNDLRDIVRGLKLDYGRAWAKDRGIPLQEEYERVEDRDEFAGKNKPRFSFNQTALASAFQQIRESRFDPHADGVVVKEGKNRTVMGRKTILERSACMDLKDEDNAAAFLLLKGIFQDAKKKTEAKGAHLIILLIPSKEAVFYSYLKEKGDALPAYYQQMFDIEQVLSSDVKQYLDAAGINYVDPFLDLKRGLETGGAVYPAWDDGHPLPAGYAIYAKAVYDAINKNPVK